MRNREIIICAGMALWSCFTSAGGPDNQPSKLCTGDVAKLTIKAKSALKAGDPDKAFQMLYECGAALTDEDALSVKAQARAAANKKAEKRDAVNTEKARAQLAGEKKRKGVYIGMSQQDVVDSSWGRPSKINRTTTSTLRHEQWIYGGSYLYFDNGILTAIQD